MGRPENDEGSKSYEYINEFLYFIVRPDQSAGRGAFIYCSGANMFHFLPITKGRHGLASNSTLRGLQLVNLELVVMAQAQGTSMRPLGGSDCTGTVPLKEGWYREVFRIENAPGSFPEEVIRYGAVNLLKKIGNACILPDTMPSALLAPGELQTFIESLCNKYQGNHDLRDIGKKAAS